MTDKQTPPDWVLIEAAKRGNIQAHGKGEWAFPTYRAVYRSNATFRALCDMIERYEQPPVDRKLLCALEAMRNGSNGKIWSKEEVGIRAIELWIEGYGE